MNPVDKSVEVIDLSSSASFPKRNSNNSKPIDKLSLAKFILPPRAVTQVNNRIQTIENQNERQTQIEQLEQEVNELKAKNYELTEEYNAAQAKVRKQALENLDLKRKLSERQDQSTNDSSLSKRQKVILEKVKNLLEN